MFWRGHACRRSVGPRIGKASSRGREVDTQQPSPRARRGDVPLTRLAFALPAAFAGAAPSAAVGVGGMENAMSQWRRRPQRHEPTGDNHMS